ncbi:MAG: hypothetical protein ACFFF4_10655 [Candidatus Thorarchaeota archaeon]
MEDRSISAGDFDTKMKSDRSDYSRYFVHGLILSLCMPLLLSYLSFLSNMMKTGFDYITIYSLFPPASAPAPFISGIFLIDFSAIGLFLLIWAFGYFNLYLNERIWKTKQVKNWERQVSIGALLFVCLLSYHVLSFFFFFLEAIGLVLFASFQVLVFPLIDGVIGRNVTTLEFD